MKQIKSKERVNKYAEVFTAEREVKAMCDLIPRNIWSDIKSTFLEPACGTGNFLAEILNRKFLLCKTSADGLAALSSVFGVDIQIDNVQESRERLFEMFCDKFPKCRENTKLKAMNILSHNIAWGNTLENSPEELEKWADGGNLKPPSQPIK